MSSAKHTQGRMEYGHVGLERFWIGTSHDATPIACVLIDDDDLAVARDNARDNAARIAHTWNCHDELLSALEQALACMDAPGFDREWQNEVCATGRAAITKARVKANE